MGDEMEQVKREDGGIRDEVPAAPVTPEDYGTSWKEISSDEGTAGCMIIGFAAIAAPVLLVCLLVRLFGLM